MSLGEFPSSSAVLVCVRGLCTCPSHHCLQSPVEPLSFFSASPLRQTPCSPRDAVFTLGYSPPSPSPNLPRPPFRDQFDAFSNVQTHNPRSRETSPVEYPKRTKNAFGMSRFLYLYMLVCRPVLGKSNGLRCESGIKDMELFLASDGIFEN